jgi:CRP-like cAMP-binding protein
VNRLSAQLAPAASPNLHRTNRVLTHLLAAGPDGIHSRLRRVRLDINDSIYDNGDVVNHVYFPLDSVVSSLGIFSDGATVEISMLGDESVVGLANLFGDRKNRFWTRMSQGGQLFKLAIDDFLSVFNDSKQVAEVVLQSYNALLLQISQRSICNVRHSVMERFCCWLLMVQDRMRGESLRLTQELVASRLGTRRAGITVAARLLLDECAIEYSRGSLTIKNREMVEHHACECYALLKRKEPAPMVSNVVPSRGLMLPVGPSSRMMIGS